MSISISLFGRLEIHDGNDARHGEASSKACELLAYLLLNRNRSHPREKLASILWGRVRSESASAYLRKALWKLRKVLEREDRPFLLSVDREWVGLNSRAEYTLDVEEFEEAFSVVRDIRPRDLDTEDVNTLSRCARLYEGDLLENLYRDWCAMDRERLQHFYLIALDKLADYYELQAQYDAGLQWAHQALQVDPARECTHRRIMRLQYRAGDRTGALRQYKKCREVLADHLDVAPTSETEELRQCIRSGDSVPAGGMRGTDWGTGNGARPGNKKSRLHMPDEMVPLLHEEFRDELNAIGGLTGQTQDGD